MLNYNGVHYTCDTCAPCTYLILYYTYKVYSLICYTHDAMNINIDVIKKKKKTYTRVIIINLV